MSAAGADARGSGVVVHRYGDHALLVDLTDLDEVRALRDELAARPVGGVTDVVPAARTVLLLLDHRADVSTVGAAVRGRVSRTVARREPALPGPLVEIPVVYDGQDLDDVAAWARLSVAEVVARHSEPEYDAAFGGFMPGFTYLTGVDPRIAVPRLATPRTRVPAGAVAIAGEQTAVYPAETPGGWRLLGTADVRLFDADRDPPALVPPGVRVRFRPVDRHRVVAGTAAGGRAHDAVAAHDPGTGPSAPTPGTVPSVSGRPAPGAVGTPEGGVEGGSARTESGSLAASGPAAGSGPDAGPSMSASVQPVVGASSAPASMRAAPAASTMPVASAKSPVDAVVEVLEPGPLALVEDGGRPGLAAIGVGRSGAADRASWGLANRVVGNGEDAAAIEVTLGGLVLRFLRRATIGLAGAPLPATLDGTPVGLHAALEVPSGTVLRLGLPARGLRTYLAVRGGVELPPVLGARSWDALARLGPRPLAAGDLLQVGKDAARVPPEGVVPVRHPVGAPRPGERLGGPTLLRIRAGARREWFAPEALVVLQREEFAVSPDSNRVALRLAGAPVPRVTGELPSEGLVPGALQVPPDGRPVLFLADHPVTGGYPVVGVVRDADVDRAAQLRPGDRLRFRLTD